MLNKNWLPQDRTFNPHVTPKNPPNSYRVEKFKNLAYHTCDYEHLFSNIDTAIVMKDMVDQQNFVTKESSLYLKYNFINKRGFELIWEIYENFYYKDWFFFKKDDLKHFLIRSNKKESTFIHSSPAPPPLQSPLPPTKPNSSTTQTTSPLYNLTDNENKDKQVYVSREAIRNITGYSSRVVPKWSNKEVYIEWQDALLEDDSDEIIIDGSRQIGKSFTIAEKAIELSFIPWEDTLVGWFIKKTTDVIRNYFLRHTRWFDKWIFIHYKSEWYILNTESGTKIYFRTLDNWAENVLGLTLKNIIIDEAQLIQYSVFEDVLEPTLATTDGRMILIGTPGMTARWYYYDKIMQCKKWIEASSSKKKIAVKSDQMPWVSYYQIDITQNPLISPKKREKIMATRNKASTQRQYFCNWNSGQDTLFSPKLCKVFPTISTEGYITVTFDPARKWSDRSAFAISFTIDNKCYFILSGFVPKEHKKQWGDQIKYYNDKILQSFLKHGKLLFWVDLRGIWEWFVEAFKTFYKDDRKTLIQITYTSWYTETIKGMEWTTSKSKLIENAVEMTDSKLVEVVEETNKDLMEEFMFLYEDEDRYGRMGMKSWFKDDISNAYITNLYIVKNRKLLQKSNIQSKEKTSQEIMKEWNAPFTPPKKKSFLAPKKNTRVW